MCRRLNVKNTYLEACGDRGNVVVGGTKSVFIDLRWSETKLREGVGGRNASKNAAARFVQPATLIAQLGSQMKKVKVKTAVKVKVKDFDCSQALFRHLTMT